MARRRGVRLIPPIPSRASASTAFAAQRSGPLAGLNVLECGNAGSAAFCALLLAQLGAHVIKLSDGAHDHEGPQGPGELLVKARRVYYDRAKEIHIDTLPSRFEERLSDVDVLLVGVDLATPQKIRNLHERLTGLRTSHPGLVCTALTPFGLAPPKSERFGSDLNAQAISGWTAITGNADAPPLAVMYDVCVMQHGLAAAVAVIAAILNRRPHPSGDLIDVSEADVLAADIRMYSGSYRGYDIAMTRNGHRAPGSSGRYPHTVLPCKDGLVVLICRSDVEWDRFIEMIGQPDWASGSRYRDFYAMATEYPDEVDALLIEWLERHTQQEIADLAIRYRVPIAPVRTVHETLADVQMRYRGFYQRTVDGTASLPWLPAQWTRIAENAPSVDSGR
jgi:crotonobetainyl-CoA:carnitine CoA-transferase CaiB-like acyl-CoA transferase